MSAYHGRDFSRDWISQNSYGIENKDVYCFGIYTGWSCGQVGYDFKTINKQPNAFWGFDSFEGLPDETEGIYKHPDWNKGCFNSMHIGKPEELMTRYSKEFNERSGFEIEFIKGFYSDSLTDQLVIDKNMKPACFVDMDADLYVSTIDAMDWMARNSLIQNTVFYFDDWAGCTDFSFGEAKAMIEICQKYQYKYEKLWQLGNGPTNQTVYLIN